MKENCPEGKDYNSPKTIRSRAQLDSEWEKSVKMSLIARDLMVGNPKLAEMGFGEEAHGHNAIASGFQGQRQWTDYQPNGDFLEAILNTSFDWNGIRAPYIVATENDCLNGASMLFGHLLTNTAQIFADVRTYWSADSVKRVSGHELEGEAANGILHLINSGPATLDGTGQQESDGQPAMKPFWEISKDEAEEMSRRDDVASVHHGIFPRRRLEHALSHPRRNARDDVPFESGQRPRPGAANRRRLDGGFAGESPRRARPAHEPDVADDVVCAPAHRPRRVPRCLFGDEQLGREPRRHQLRPHRRGSDFAGGDAADSGLYAQRRGGTKCSVRAPGRRSARPIWKARIIAPARISARSTPERVCARFLKLFFRAAIVFIELMTPVAVVVYCYPEKILCVDSGV